MIDDSLSIRKLRSKDIKSAMKLVLAEGWNQTEKDWQILMGHPQNVCLVALLKNKLAGTATAINYNNRVAWIGMVLVDKALRGRGISKVLLSSLFKQLIFCESIKLDATPAGQPVYEKMGFENEYLIHRMVCPLLDKIPPATGNMASHKIQKEDITTIIELDKRVFGTDRSQLITSLISNFSEKCIVIKRDNQITGFALGRKGNKYHQIGPVITKSPSDALLLVRSALTGLQGQSVVIDIPGDKNKLKDALCSFGFEKQRDFTRMFKYKNRFPGKINFHYAISGPEFG